MRVIVLVALSIGFLYIFVIVLGLDPRENIAYLLLIFMFALIADYLSVSFISFEIAEPGAKIKTDGETEHAELIEEVESELSQLEREERSRQAKREPDWLCDACGEVNAYSFDSCWKCGHEGRRGAI